MKNNITFEYLLKEDLEKIMNFISEKNIKIKYWENNLETEENKWFIDEVNIYDFLSYYMDLNLHWTKLWEPLVDEIIKQNIFKIV